MISNPLALRGALRRCGERPDRLPRRGRRRPGGGDRGHRAQPASAPGIALNPETPAEAVAPVPRTARPAAGHDRASRLGRPAVHRRGAAEDAERCVTRSTGVAWTCRSASTAESTSTRSARRTPPAGRSSSPAAPCTARTATWRPRSPRCGPPPRARVDPAPRGTDLRCRLAASCHWRSLVVSRWQACSEDGPRLPVLPTPSPTPEQPREVTLTVVTRRHGEAVAVPTIRPTTRRRSRAPMAPPPSPPCAGPTSRSAAGPRPGERRRCPTRARWTSSCARTW